MPIARTHSDDGPPEEPFPNTSSADVGKLANGNGSTNAHRSETDPPSAYPFLAPRLMPDELGRLGPYRVLAKLGEGGMGVVFEAEEPALRRRVALKVMLPKFAENDLAKVRFFREARAQAAVEHDHIIAIFQIGEDRGVPYIAMPLLRGMTLAAALRANPQVPVEEALRIGREMAEGLEAAHAKGLIHRDVKPGNVWLEGDRRRVKLLDFGLARVETESLDSSDGPSTRPGMALGTPAYMSPEQARGHSVDRRTDLFSLGVVLYEMTAGERPFKGTDVWALLTALAVDHPAPPDRKNPAVPPALAALVMRLLAKDAVERPDSASAVVEELQRIADSPNRPMVVLAPPAADDPWADIDATDTGLEIAAAQVPHTRPANADPATPGLPWKPMLIAMAVLLLLGGGAGIWLATREKPAPVVRTPEPPKPLPPKKTPTRIPDDDGELVEESPLQEDVNWNPDLNIGPGGIKFGADGLPRLTAPFTPAEAKQAQDAWAKHLGMKVEESIVLGDGVTMEVVLIPPGTFIMGSPPSEKTRKANEVQHPVEITKPFYLGKHEVTQKQYKNVFGSNPSAYKDGGKNGEQAAGIDSSNHPVEQISVLEANAFCEQVAKAFSRKGTCGLPSEAEWEYSCRGGTATSFHFGNAGPNFLQYGNRKDKSNQMVFGIPAGGSAVTYDDGYAITAPVGSFNENAFGLFDVHGNVREMCCDMFGSYQSLPRIDPLQAAKAQKLSYAVRGGSWRDSADLCRSACRLSIDTSPKQDVGFRVCFHLDDLNLPTGLRLGADGLPRLIAPFTPEQAKQAQEAWAKHLGRKVVETLDLGNGVKLDAVLIPPGTFRMGSPPDEQDRKDDEDPHAVEITKPFYIGKHEVTQSQYQQVMGGNPSAFSVSGSRSALVAGKDTTRYPVEMVTWLSAKKFCEQISPRFPSAVRGTLPTEAQWEYAGRGGSTTRFHFGGSATLLPEYGNISGGEDGYPVTAPVGQFKSNAFGLNDIHGNVAEYCLDAYQPYNQLPRVDPVGVLMGATSGPVIRRGGAWTGQPSSVNRITARGKISAGVPHDFVGFRVAFHID